VDFTPEQLAMLERQVAYFRDDDRIREEVELWRDASPEERLEEMAAMCRFATHFLQQHDPETQERASMREPLPADTIAILEAIKRR
jgi:hypothetical protein